MTRRELANSLLADDSRLDEEVVIFDYDTGRYYEVCNIESKQIDKLPYGEMMPLLTGQFVRFRDKDAVIKEVTVIS